MIPPLPPARGEGQDGGVAELRPRYEDVSQDGRLQLTSLMPGLGAAVWHKLLSKIPVVHTFRAQGILPILSRLVIMGEERSVSVSVPVRYRGSFRFARELGGDRLFVNMWLEATAPIASTLAPNPPADAPHVRVGRIFAEHVITRPFSPPGERRVTKLDAPGMPSIPEDEHPFETAEDLLDDAALDDAGDTTFGMMHTDSNQHVNSLVYPRIFEEAAARRFMQDARITGAHQLLARAVELRFRRPFFAGERARLQMAIVEPPEGEDRWKVGAVGAFSSDGASAGASQPVGAASGTPAAPAAPRKPSCAVKMWFR